MLPEKEKGKRGKQKKGKTRAFMSVSETTRMKYAILQIMLLFPLPIIKQNVIFGW